MEVGGRVGCIATSFGSGANLSKELVVKCPSGGGTGCVNNLMDSWSKVRHLRKTSRLVEYGCPADFRVAVDFCIFPWFFMPLWASFGAPGSRVSTTVPVTSRALGSQCRQLFFAPGREAKAESLVVHTQVRAPCSLLLAVH